MEESCGKSQGFGDKKVTPNYISCLPLVSPPICLVSLSRVNPRTCMILPGSRVRTPVGSINSQFLYSTNLTIQMLRLAFIHREQMRGQCQGSQMAYGEREIPYCASWWFLPGKSLCKSTRDGTKLN